MQYRPTDRSRKTVKSETKNQAQLKRSNDLVRRYLLASLLVAVFSSTYAGGGGDDGIGGTQTGDTIARIGGKNVDAGALFKPILSRDLGTRMNPELNRAAQWDSYELNMYKIDMSQFRESINYLINDPGNGYVFTMPSGGMVTSGFGPRRLFGSHFHFGVDLDLETGDEVMAAMDGIIRIARYCGGYGNAIVICHSGGLETVYGHLSEIQVEEGQKVKSGEVIGLGGNTGHSTGSHLHFECRIFGEQIDPMRIVAFGDAKSVAPKSITVNADWFSHISTYGSRNLQDARWESLNEERHDHVEGDAGGE